jgi:uncharacterized protein YqjF (DUF2071 family)
VTRRRHGERVPSADPPPFHGPTLLTQTWRDLLYVHWPVRPDSVAQFFPAGTRPDTLDGHTYIGVVGLTMSSTRVGAMLGIGSIDELNVRLYSVDNAGRQGVVFLSMDVSRPDVALTGRLALGLPYLWSDVHAVRTSDINRGLRIRRRRSSRLHATVEVQIGDPLTDPAPLEVFLTARFWLHTTLLRRTTVVQLTHPPFPLSRACLGQVDTSLLTAVGLPLPNSEPMGVLWSPGVDARIGRPRGLSG